MEFNNRGILFRNYRKKQPKHPDVVGEATVDGRKYKLAGWLKQGKRGEFHSLAFTEDEPEAAMSTPAPPDPCGVPAYERNDDVPF
jgi:hypothetical protein